MVHSLFYLNGMFRPGAHFCALVISSKKSSSQNDYYFCHLILILVSFLVWSSQARGHPTIWFPVTHYNGVAIWMWVDSSSSNPLFSISESTLRMSIDIFCTFSEMWVHLKSCDGTHSMIIWIDFFFFCQYELCLPWFNLNAIEWVSQAMTPVSGHCKFFMVCLF